MAKRKRASTSWKNIKVNAGTLNRCFHEFGVEFPCGGKGICGSCKVKLLRGELKVDTIQQQKLVKLKLPKTGGWLVFVQPNLISRSKFRSSKISFLPTAQHLNSRPQTGFGIAVDLGTTTVVVQLVNLENGHVLDSVSDLNPQ
jgi:uncharacterized 2Fe-2S/4Fe-4S cluster protein (DUF4445 family)